MGMLCALKTISARSGAGNRDKAPCGRASSNGGVVVLYLACACGGNQFGQGFPSDAGEREVNDIGVAEEVVQKRFNRFQRVGSTELKENYPHTPCCARHFP